MFYLWVLTLRIKEVFRSRLFDSDGFRRPVYDHKNGNGRQCSVPDFNTTVPFLNGYIVVRCPGLDFLNLHPQQFQQFVPETSGLCLKYLPPFILSLRLIEFIVYPTHF